MSRFSAMYVKFVFSNVIQELYSENEFVGIRTPGEEIERLYHCEKMSQILAVTEENIRQYEAFLNRSVEESTEKVLRMTKYISEHYGENLTREGFADEFSIAPGFLGFVFRRTTGMSLNRYLRTVRMEKAKELLEKGVDVPDICRAVGYKDEAYLLDRVHAFWGDEIYNSLVGNNDMRKKLFIILGALLIAGVILFCILGLPYIRRHYQTVQVNRTEAAHMEPVDMGGMKALIVCFTRVGNTDFAPDVDAVSSASLMIDAEREQASDKLESLVGNSELLADMVSNATGFPIYDIRVKDLYSSSYNDTVSEANEELRSGEIRELTGDLPDVTEYDSIILVYPLWWGTLPQPVQTFLKEVDLSGKTLYSIVTHGGSKFGNALSDTENLTAADVSRNALEVYDDDVTEAAAKVAAWLESL